MAQALQCDIAIIGGGLAGSMLALGLREQRPDLKVTIFDKATKPCGNHTWCLHEADLPRAQRSWILPLLSRSWSGYDVAFPKFEKHFEGGYHSLKSEDLARAVLDRTTFQGDLSVDDVIEQPDHRFVLASEGKTVANAGLVIFATGWRSAHRLSQLGWQKFVGWEVELSAPHGRTVPLLKDVRVPQIDGYRFVYTLPFGERSLLVEDTRYSNTPEIDPVSFANGIKDYVQSKGWAIEKVLRTEQGALPLYLDPPSEVPHENPSANSTSKLVRHPWIGAGSHFVHPVTGYTFPMTLKVIDALLRANRWDSREALLETIADVEASMEWQMRYLRALNRMLFLAARPEDRYKVLERFYQLPQGLIERFYAGDLTWKDQLRIVSGKPPVPILKALSALTTDL